MRAELPLVDSGAIHVAVVLYTVPPGDVHQTTSYQQPPVLVDNCTQERKEAHCCRTDVTYNSFWLLKRPVAQMDAHLALQAADDASWSKQRRSMPATAPVHQCCTQHKEHTQDHANNFPSNMSHGALSGVCVGAHRFCANHLLPRPADACPFTRYCTTKPWIMNTSIYSAAPTSCNCDEGCSERLCASSVHRSLHTRAGAQETLAGPT